ncbi:MAG TPA: PTS sugar transporter subunit IIA [Burkholderiales bacterium]|jgi:PTS system nitrogen regulatory IIA component|nr:PTS sugar transporter subunit IIA [Burkholderiales bacterium]
MNSPIQTPSQVIARLLPETNVALDLELASKRRVFDEAGMLFQHHQGIARSTVFDSLFARERLGSTGLGQGVAIPHGRIAKLAAPIGAFLRLKEAIPFEAPDGRPVNLLFFVLMPEKDTNSHLQILASLAEIFADIDARARLAALPDAASVHRELTGAR